MNSHQIYSPGHFTVLCHFCRHLLFHFICFYKRWDSWRGLYGVFLTSIITVELQGVTTWYMPYNWRSPPNTQPCVNGDIKSNWLWREVGNIEVDCFLPKIKLRMFHLHSSFLPFIFQILTWSSLHYFCLALAWSNNCSHVSGHYKEG